VASDSESEKIEELAKILATSTDSNQKLSAIEHLKKSGNNRLAQSVLGKVASDTSEVPIIRKAASQALGWMQSEAELSIPTFLRSRSNLGKVSIAGGVITGRPERPTTTDATYRSVAPSNNIVELGLSNNYHELLTILGQELGLSDGDVIRMGLVLLGFASKAKQQGLKLAVVDDDGIVIANIDGI
jgi:hypothetical protein